MAIVQYDPNDSYANYSDEDLAKLPGAPKRGAQGGYVYSWRPGAYQNVLGDRDVEEQQGLQSFRQSAPGHVAEDDLGALAQMRGEAPVTGTNQITGASTPNASPADQWASQPAAPATAAPATPAAPTAPATSTATSTTAPAYPEETNKFFDELWGRIHQPITPDPNDPTIRRQADAYSASQTRQMRDYMSDLAERAGPYANLQGEGRLAAERAGQASGQFEAELIGREQQARRAEIQQDLSLYGSLLTDEQKIALQDEMNDIDAQLRGRGLDIQERLGLGDLDIRQGQLKETTASRQTDYDKFLRELALRQWGMGEDNDYRWSMAGLL